MQVVLIERDGVSTDFLPDKLANIGWRIERARSVEQVLRSQLADHVAAIILETRTAGKQTASEIARLRAGNVIQPLIVISAYGDWRDKVACLDAGADDLIFKPVRSEEVDARIRALVRRSSGIPSDRIVSGDLEVDLKTKCAWLQGECLDLTRNEYRMLKLFVLNSGRVLGHAELREKLYPESSNRSLNAIEVQIARLRRKIGRNSIRTIRGVGYRYSGERPLSGTGAGDRNGARSSCSAGESNSRETATVAAFENSGWSPSI